VCIWCFASWLTREGKGSFVSFSSAEREKQLQFSPLLLARERGKKTREKKERDRE